MPTLAICIRRNPLVRVVGGNPPQRLEALTDSGIAVTAGSMTTKQPEVVSLAIIDWRRGKWSSAKGKYSRKHTWLMAGGAKLRVPDSESIQKFHEVAVFEDGFGIRVKKCHRR